jgi:hypothetical protein
MGGTCVVHVMEEKSIDSTIFLKRSNGVTLAKDNHKKNKTHEFMLRTQAKAIVDMVATTLMKVKSLSCN